MSKDLRGAREMQLVQLCVNFQNFINDIWLVQITTLLIWRKTKECQSNTGALHTTTSNIGLADWTLSNTVTVSSTTIKACHLITKPEFNTKLYKVPISHQLTVSRIQVN